MADVSSTTSFLKQVFFVDLQVTVALQQKSLYPSIRVEITYTECNSFDAPIVTLDSFPHITATFINLTGIDLGGL